MHKNYRTLFFVISVLVSLGLQPARAATLYAVGGGAPALSNSGLWTLDPSTGTPSFVGGMSTHIGPFGSYLSIYNGGLTYDPHHNKLYALGCDGSSVSWLYTVNPLNGDVVQSAVSPAPANNTGAFCSGGLAYDIQSHVLYAVGDTTTGPGGSGLWTIDPNTGAGTFIGNSGTLGRSVSGIGIDPQTGVLYGNGRASNSNPPDGAWSALMTIDKGTGIASFIGYHGLNVGRQMGYSGLAFDPVTNVMYGLGSSSASQQNLYTVNKGTGQVTPVGGPMVPGFGVDGALVFVGPEVVGVEGEAVAPKPFLARSTSSTGEVLFSFSLDETADTTITLYDLSGRLVTKIENHLSIGAHEVKWNGQGDFGRVSSGIYFATLTADDKFVGKTKITIVR